MTKAWNIIYTLIIKLNGIRLTGDRVVEASLLDTVKFLDEGDMLEDFWSSDL